MHTLWGKWAPPQERSLLASITYAGKYDMILIINHMSEFVKLFIDLRVPLSAFLSKKNDVIEFKCDVM